tara:strand:- start:75 stop:1733 length:1659 start_codon:yes stop_codon:yes gene_type:complete
MAQKFNLLIQAKTVGQAGIKKMGNSMQGLQGRLKNVRMAALSVNTAFKAMAVILAAGAFSRVVTGAINQADAFGKLSRQTGIAADTLQSYVNAGKLAGVEQGTIEKGLRRLAQSMREANQGVATYEDAYKALGVTVRDSGGNLKDSEVVLGQLADRFKEMPNGATKAALAMEIFGRSGAQLIPMLNEGGDALERWNYETSEGFEANAEYFNDQLTMLGFGFDGFRKQLADELLPALNSIVEAFQDLFDSKNDWNGLFEAISISVRTLAFGLMSTAVALEEVGHYLARLKRRAGRMFGGKAMDDPDGGYVKGVMERFKRNQEIFKKITVGESEAGDAYGFKKGTEDANKFGKEIDKTFGSQMKSKLTSFNNSIKTVGEGMSDVFIKGIKGMEDALTDFVMGGKLSFKSLANSIIKDMVRMAIQQSITKPLSGWFSGLFSAKGNVFENGQHVTAYAKGGVINKPHFKYMADGGVAVAGEAGSEAVLPLKRGADGNLGVVSQGGSSTSVVVNVDATGGSEVQGEEGQARMLGKLIAAAVKNQIANERRPGGLLYG